MYVLARRRLSLCTMLTLFIRGVVKLAMRAAAVESPRRVTNEEKKGTVRRVRRKKRMGVDYEVK